MIQGLTVAQWQEASSCHLQKRSCHQAQTGHKFKLQEGALTNSVRAAGHWVLSLLHSMHHITYNPFQALMSSGS